MTLLLAALGATVAALVEVTLTPYITVGDAAPHPVLVGGIIWTIAAGIGRGIAWAFVGGIVLDSLLGRPLGVSAFALLVCAGGAALASHLLPRLRLVAPVVAVPLLSLVNSFLILALASAARDGGVVADPGALMVPGMVYDGLIGMFVGPLVVMFHDRRTAPERGDWA